jgi:hypothetical protein
VYEPVGGDARGAIRDYLNENMNQLTVVRQGQIELIDTVKNKLEQMDGRIPQLLNIATDYNDSASGTWAGYRNGRSCTQL